MPTKQKYLFSLPIRLLIYLFLLVFVGHFAGTYALGFFVKKIFSEGTGCVVHLEKPELAYFPLRGLVHNVHVYHPSEGPEAGFKAKKIRLDVSTELLSEKVVLFKELTISGARVSSLGPDTAFLSVIDFLFGEEARRARENSKSPWKVWLPTTRISTQGRKDSLFRIGTEEHFVDFKTFEFIARDPKRGKEFPALLEARGGFSQYFFKEESGEVFGHPLGELQAQGRIHKGVFSLRTAYLRDRFAKSLTKAKGKIVFEGEEKYYDLDFVSNFTKQYVSKALAARPAFVEGGAAFKFIPGGEAVTKLAGGLTEPSLSGVFDLALTDVADLGLKETCGFESIKGEFNLDSDGLRLEKTELEDLVKELKFSLAFDRGNEFSLTYDLSVFDKSEYINRCFFSKANRRASFVRGESSEMASFRLTLTEALRNSRSQVALAGTLSPQNLAGSIDADLYTSSVSATAKLNAEFQIKQNAFTASLSETGTHMQIATRAERSSGSKQTSFTAQKNSKVQAKFEGDISSHSLKVKQLDVERYPSERLLARISPFIPPEKHKQAKQFLGENSLLSLKLNRSVALLPALKVEAASLASISVSDLYFGPLLVESLETEVAYKNNAFVMEGLTLGTEGGEINGKARFDLESERSELSLSTKKLGFQALPKAFEFLDGDVDFELTAKFAEAGPSVLLSGNARSKIKEESKFFNKDLPYQTTSFELKNKGSNYFFAADLFDSQGTIGLELKDSGAVTLNFEAERLEFANFLKTDSGNSKETILSGKLKYKGNLNEPLAGKGEAEVPLLRYQAEGIKIREATPLKLAVRQGVLTFDSANILVNERPLDISGAVSKKEGWKIGLEGSWELATFSALVPELEHLTGELVLNVDVLGNLDTPLLSGSLGLKDGAASILLDDAEIGLDKIQSELVFAGTSAEIKNFDARLGTGTVVGRGTITNIFSEAEREFESDFLLSDVELQPYDSFSVSLEGLLRFVGLANKAPMLSGQIRLLEAVYEEHLNLGSLLSSIASRIAGESLSGSSSGVSLRNATGDDQSLEFDLKVVSENGLIVETDIAEGQLEANLHLLGTAETPLLDGEISTLEGAFNLGSNSFDVLLGRLSFSPSQLIWDPQVELTAESRVGAVTREEHNIRLSVLGPLSQPQIQFSSDSGLTESEIVAMFGLGSGGLTILSSSGTERSITELINPLSKLSLSERIVGLAGFSEVQIETGLSEDSGEFVPKVGGRRRFIGESQLSVRSELANRSLSQVDITYPITSSLSANAGWRSQPVTDSRSQSAGSYSAGFRFRETFSGTGVVPSFSKKEIEAAK